MDLQAFTVGRDPGGPLNLQIPHVNGHDPEGQPYPNMHDVNTAKQASSFMFGFGGLSDESHAWVSKKGFSRVLWS